MKATVYFINMQQFNAAFPKEPKPEYQIGLHGISVDVKVKDMKEILERVSEYENSHIKRSETTNTYYDNEYI